MVIGVNLLVAGALMSLRRTFARRRGGHYTAEELPRLGARGLAAATTHMLERDG